MKALQKAGHGCVQWLNHGMTRPGGLEGLLEFQILSSKVLDRSTPSHVHLSSINSEPFKGSIKTQESTLQISRSEALTTCEAQHDATPVFVANALPRSARLTSRFITGSFSSSSTSRQPIRAQKWQCMAQAIHHHDSDVFTFLPRKP